MIFIVSKWLLYVQQMIFIFSNGNVRFIFRNMRFAFNEMKFIKLKSFTFQQTKFRCNKICIQKHSAERNIWSNEIQSASIFSHFPNVLCTLQRWYFRAKFSVAFYYPLGQWSYANN